MPPFTSITNKLSWSKSGDLSWVTQILNKVYSCSIESILSWCITALYGNCSESDRKALQRVVRPAQYITGAKLPAIQALYNRRVRGKPM